MGQNRAQSLLAGSALLISSTFAVGAEPQQEAGAASGGLEQITVTAQKRAENMQSVPIAIAAASEEQIDTSAITNIQQLNAIVPGFNVRASAGAIQFYIRGVGTSATGVENPIAAYVDDVYYPAQRAVDLDLIDIGQIAVLKGPQGTLFGRNSTGGVIQIQTRDPGREAEVRVRTSIDNYETWRTGAWLGGPITDELRGSVMAAYTTQGEGYGRNSVAGYDTFKIDRNYAFRGKLIFDPSDSVQLRIMADQQDKSGNTGQNEVPYPGTVFQFEPTVVGSRDNAFDSRYNDKTWQHLKDGGLSASLSVETDAATLRSITAYRRGESYFAFDIDRTPVAAQFIEGLEKYTSTSQEFQVVSQQDSRLTWVLGAYYFRFVDRLTPSEVFLSGVSSPLPTSTARQASYTKQVATSYAGFGQAAYEIVPRTKLTVGARYTTEDRDFDGFRRIIQNNGTLIPNANAISDEMKASNWTLRAALDHQITDRVMAYVSFDRGFKSGGFNLNDPTNPPYEPEELDAYQIGIKSELLDRRLRLNAAAFYYDYTNLQVVSFGGSTIVSTIRNGAAAEMYGFDLDAEAQLSDPFWASAGLSVLHAEFTDFPGAVYSVPPTNPALAVQLVTGDARGNKVPFAQPVNFNLGLNYARDTSFGNLLFNVTNSYNGKFYHESDNRLYQKAYDYLNVSATWTSRDEHYRVKLWGTNLLDELVQGQAASQRIGYVANYSNPPRLVGITFDVKF